MIRFDRLVIWTLLVLSSPACIRVHAERRSRATEAKPAITAGPFRLEMQKTGTTASLRGLSVVSDQVVWASGSEGTILRTIDGGVTWRVGKVVAPMRLDVRDVHAFNADTAIAVATAGRLFRTTDGGATWQTVYAASDTSVFLDAVSFWDATHGIVLGDPMPERFLMPGDPAARVLGDPVAAVLGEANANSFLILLTDDGGATWRSLPWRDAPRAEPNEAAFAASGSALTVVGERHAWFGTGGVAGSRVFRSSDRGHSWSVARTPIITGSPSTGIFSVFFEDSLNGIVAGGDYTKPRARNANIAITADGGRSFALESVRPSQYVSAIAMRWRPLTFMFAAGTGGVAYRSPETHHWSTLDAGAWNALGAGESVLWVVGPAGRVARISMREP